jgi:hypothetical protein
MNRPMQTGLSAAISGTVVSVATTAVLGLLARTEGKGALQPTNSTSHWLYGDKAGSVRRADVAHTLVGYGTHHASSIFWAFLFETWLASRPPRPPLVMLRDALGAAAIAAAVDYGLVPKRLTPGWETVLSKRSIAATFLAMAIGLAAGGMINEELRRRS